VAKKLGGKKKRGTNERDVCPEERGEGKGAKVRT